MLLPFSNPVISAVTLPDELLVNNFKECRKIHQDIQAKESLDSPWQGENLVYLMMVGDCMAREITRRGLDEKVNLILQQPRNLFPSYWQDIVVPDFMKSTRNEVTWENVWGPDIYPSEPEEDNNKNVEADRATDAVAEPISCEESEGEASND